MLAWGVVPVCDFVAGYFNRNRWAGTPFEGEWNKIYLSELLTSSVNLGLWGTAAFMGGEPYDTIFDYSSKVGALTEFTMLYLNYRQESIIPSGTNSTNIAYYCHSLNLIYMLSTSYFIYNFYNPKSTETAPIDTPPTETTDCDPNYEVCY